MAAADTVHIEADLASRVGALEEEVRKLRDAIDALTAAPGPR